MDSIPVEILACVVYLNPNGCVRASSKMAEILPTMWEKIYTLRRICHEQHKSIDSFINYHGCFPYPFMASDQKNAPEVVKLHGSHLASKGGSFPLVHVCTQSRMFKYEPMLQIAYEHDKDGLFTLERDGGALKKSLVTDENTYIDVMAWLLSDRVFI